MHELISGNPTWMIYNSLLALIPVFLGWLVYSVQNTKIKYILFFAWLAFVPNTIYILTDIVHLLRDLKFFSPFGTLVILIRYIFFLSLGFLTYILALYPIERTFSKLIKKKKSATTTRLIIAINFLIGIGIVLGRVYRVNSWELITQSEKVLDALLQTISSPKMIALALLFGLLANFIYFLFKQQTTKYFFKKN